MNTFNGRKTLTADAKKSTPSSFGGQRNAGNTAIEHLGDVSSAAKALGNWDTGVPIISNTVNWLRQQGSTDQAAAANKLNDAVDRYVAEVGRFFAGSPSSGVSERDAARNRFSAARTGKELAAAIEAERDLFGGKLKQLQSQRDETFTDPVHADKIIGPVFREGSVKALDQINSNISALKGNAPAAATSAGSQEGQTATNPKTGQKAIFKGGKWQIL